MDKSQPIHFLNNSFIFLDGHREYFRGEKEFLSLPNREVIKVNNTNLWNSIKSVYIPVSQMCATISNKQFCNSIDGTEKMAFYDLECDDSENFILGYVNDIKFTDPIEMVKELMNYEIIIGFNTINFDNEVLSKYSRDSFYEIKNADFIAHSLKNALNIDMFSIIKTIVGKEEYSQESIAKEIGFEDEILNHDADKDEKCKQDIKILRLIWKKYDLPLVFNTLSSLVNIDTTLFQIIPKDRLRKWIFISKYLKKGILPLKPIIKEVKLSTEPFKYCKVGFYEEEYIYYDISGAYPLTAINLGNLGVYDEDNTFSELQKELYELSKNPILKPFMKSLGNPLFGSQYSQNEFFKDEEIFKIVVKTLADNVEREVKRLKNVIYSNTDCFLIPSNCDKPQINGYEIKEKYRFSEIYLYSVNKWIGKTKDRIEFRGFKKLNTRVPKILKVARDELLNKLNKKKGEEFKESLDEYEDLIKNTLKKINKFDTDYFKIVIRKKNDYCSDVEFMDIWKNLKVGFNQLYYGKDGKFTLEPSKINYKYYQLLIKSMAKEFSTDKEL